MTAYPSWTPAPRAGIVPLHPLSFGAILGRSFTALRQNPRVLLGFALGMQMIAYVVLIVAIGGAAIASFSRLDTLVEGTDEFNAVLAGSIAITTITGVVLGIASTALTVIVQGVVVADVAHGVVSEKLTVGALWRRVRPAFWRLMGYTFLSIGVVLVAVALVVGAVVVLSQLALAAGIVLAILLVLAAIPLAFWLPTKLFVVPAVLVLEGTGVFAAIGRSWRLTRGRFWKTLGVWFLVQLTFSILAQVVSVPFSILSGMLSALVAPTGSSDPAAIVGILVTSGITQIVTLLIQSVALVVVASASALVYIDARMRSEGLDHDLQSYVDQRRAGAGTADPYRWHIGRTVAPAPAPPGYTAPGYGSSPGYPGGAGYPGSAGSAAGAGYPAPPPSAPGPAAGQPEAREPSPPGEPAGDPAPSPGAPPAPRPTDWAAPGSADPTR
ncbi:glycerophosphoryl diester phosphodiesterase membrane domain-containing protein [Microbacterium sp. 18062]|uniref:glycerophosphoryl diester phosphodiesterase membrane domain-containing protein n=1 Tax=Microbacterium sp. 18062 TaxID=2681410 RepID=UPI00135C843A|nr:glycerophosphoryl diester phosphodiesterase membrane domain-containing protein [Microbacterium sp. 18062]